MTEKAQGKIDIKIGNISFSAEGDQAWLSEQLTKVMEAASTLPPAKFEPGADAPAGDTPSGKTMEPISDTLAAYLKAKGGESKQVQRFLATAGWLRRRNEKEELNPTAVAKALSRNHQKGLANAADCLNQNVRRGYCEKLEGNNFFITSDGWKQLGEQP
jgi:hypothetical protein